jgi:hypothetical protein
MHFIFILSITQHCFEMWTEKQPALEPVGRALRSNLQVKVSRFSQPLDRYRTSSADFPNHWIAIGLLSPVFFPPNLLFFSCNPVPRDRSPQHSYLRFTAVAPLLHLLSRNLLTRMTFSGNLQTANADNFNLSFFQRMTPWITKSSSCVTGKHDMEYILFY